MAQAFLQVNERIELQRIVARLYDWEDGIRGRQTFVSNAGLSKFSSSVDLSGAPRTSAGALLRQLENHGFLPERPNYHALGALLSYTLELGEAPPDDLTYMAGIIVKYDLVRDSAYTEQLRSDYTIALATEPIDDPVASTEVTQTPLAETEADVLDFEPRFDNFEGLEQVIGEEDNFLDISILAGAIYSAQAVGRIEVPNGRPVGTGFLIGPDLLLTNQHVLKDERWLEDAVIRFEYQNDLNGISSPGKVVKISTDFYHASPAEELDYALVRLEEKPLEEIMIKDKSEAENLLPIDLIRMGKHRGYLALAPRDIKHQERVNIIQHPNGDPLKVVMTQNRVAADMTDTRVHYLADTDGGSSGSAVFNRQWEVVALHHAGKPYPPLPPDKNKGKQYRVNEGIPMRAILKDLKAKRLDRHLPRS